MGKIIIKNKVNGRADSPAPAFILFPRYKMCGCVWVVGGDCIVSGGNRLFIDNWYKQNSWGRYCGNKNPAHKCCGPMQHRTYEHTVNLSQLVNSRAVALCGSAASVQSMNYKLLASVKQCWGPSCNQCILPLLPIYQYILVICSFAAWYCSTPHTYTVGVYVILFNSKVFWLKTEWKHID